jgi:hypothetical protein
VNDKLNKKKEEG